MSLRVDWKHPSTRKIILSYLPDWILVAVMAGAFFGIDRITPFLREFSLEDKTIMHPHSPKDSVPMWVVGVSFILEFGFMYLCVSVRYWRGYITCLATATHSDMCYHRSFASLYRSSLLQYFLLASNVA